MGSYTQDWLTKACTPPFPKQPPDGYRIYVRSDCVMLSSFVRGKRYESTAVPIRHAQHEKSLANALRVLADRLESGEFD